MWGATAWARECKGERKHELHQPIPNKKKRGKRLEQQEKL
jgi:hypothetical protein